MSGVRGAEAKRRKPTSVGGWNIETKKTRMLGREEIAALETHVFSSSSTSARGALPEMVFASTLTLEHPRTKTRIEFNARDALKQWKLAKNEVVKVKCAEQWMRAHVERERERDMPTKMNGAKTTGGGEEEDCSYDWTFTTPYRGTTVVDGVDVSDNNEENDSSRCFWKRTDDCLDMVLLKRRDPIELFDEVILYESELDDHGISSLSVKIRVTEKCWFLLLRFWLCVDGVLVRSRETRMCCDLRCCSENSNGVVIIRETRLREETWSQLRDRGAPTDPKQFKDPEDAASTLLASGGPVLVFHEKFKE